MADYSGRRVSYALSLENTRGVAVNPGNATGEWVRWETADFTDTAMVTMNQSALNVLDKYSQAEVTEAWSVGQIAGKITDHAIGFILYPTFGQYGVALKGGETTVWVHTFTESQLNAAKTVTVTRVDPNNSYQYAGCMVNSLEITAKPGDFVRHTTQFIGQPNTTPAAQVVGYTPDENEFTGKHINVTFNGGANIPLANFKLTISKNAQPYWIIGQTNPSDIFATAVEVKGEMTLRFTDQTYYTAMFTNTDQSVIVTILNTDVTIGSTSHPTLTFSMPICNLSSWKPVQSLDGMVEQTVEFEALFSLTNGYTIKSTLTNTMSNYPEQGGIS